MKSKVFGILLIFCFVAPVATTYLVLQLQKKQVKREVKLKMIAGIDREELVLLKFTEEEKQTQLNWKHSKEFEYRGQMYDIVETSIIGDTIYYLVWWDHEETKLNRQLDELVHFALRNSPKNQENQKRLQEFFNTLYFIENKIKESFAFTEAKNKCHFGQKTYYSISHSPPVPPPEKS